MKLPLPCLMLVTDRHRTAGRPLADAVRQAVDAGVDVVQLREKDLPDDELHRLAQRLRQITAGSCRLIVNSRLDVAIAVEADGVHLPENGGGIASVRRLAPPGFLVGRSVHSASAAQDAARDGADYVQLGTIFATQSKAGKAPDGLRLVRAATAGLDIPCLGVGGIDPGNGASVIAAGAQGVAVVSAILGAENIPVAVQALRRSLAAAGVTRMDWRVSSAVVSPPSSPGRPSSPPSLDGKGAGG